jgi:pyruvate/2-oxoglutarate dehydrogenase complex dihydrolipoamide acyltransferase (E2) component
VARFYGQVTVPTGAPITNLTITGSVGSTTCSGTQSGVAGSATTNSGQYILDIQAVPGCTTPGSTVSFTVAGFRARETGTIPDLPGTPIHLDLHFQAPATPTVAPSTPAATPPRPPSTPAATPPPVVATAPRPVQTPVAQRPVSQQGVAPKVPAAPVRGAGGAAPRLPSTGTGGLLDQQSSTSLTGWALALVVLAGLGVSASGLFAYRRSR